MAGKPTKIHQILVCFCLVDVAGFEPATFSV